MPDQPFRPRASLRAQLLTTLIVLSLLGVALHGLSLWLIGPTWLAGGVGPASLRSMLLMLLTSGLVVVALVWCLDHFIHRRIGDLRRFLEQALRSPGRLARLQLAGQDDDLARAATALNGLLGQLGQDQEAHRSQADVMRLVVQSGTVNDVLGAIRTILQRRYPGAYAELFPDADVMLPGATRPTWLVPVRSRGAPRDALLRLTFPDHLPPDITTEAAWMADLLGVAAEQERLRQELSQYAFHDELTGLLNRRGLLRHLGSRLGSQLGSPLGSHLGSPLGQGPRREGSLVGLLHVDFDRFKRLNDLLGHAAGDELLRLSAERLQRAALTGGQAARLGSDEFVLMITHLSDRASLEVHAEQVCEALRQPVQIQGHTFHPGVSAGLSVAPDDSRDAETLLRYAALATEQVKQQWPGRVIAYQPDMNAARVERLQLEQDLRDTLSQGGPCPVSGRQTGLGVAYQPQVNLHTQEVCGFEALLRWTHPTRGEISPDIFIAIAEEAGLITQLGHWMLSQVATQITVWRDSGVCIPVAVNLSAAQLLQDDIVGQIEALLELHGLPPQALILEITESLLMSGAPDLDAYGTLSRLSALGLKVAVDDFGTGYSSLSYLHRLPIHTIKVDRSFVRELPGSLEAAGIAETIIRLGKQLNLKVLAEGIETPGQARMLRDLGCEAGQGYLYAAALDAPQVPAFLQARRIALLP
ncbi:putative bifunctional diguanylate cyclase/phosphodiesterase [Deinococcus koreensis]|uniref:GGDEF-domain containing protein n=1 Tax=Deinococcus koreensis TaxID=2054903 RepID=A0A2K3UUP8_9DEIO|nr:bifunctional diguanylate cyclase/phosphodiesterase [Deinococcus koreensis]PNY80259.1 hypothetical protein CVO96_01780 [Deinococcus koreensis]